MGDSLEENNNCINQPLIRTSLISSDQSDQLSPIVASGSGISDIEESPINGRKTPLENFLYERNIQIKTPSENPSVVGIISKLPATNDAADTENSKESPHESSMVIEGSNSPDSGFRNRKKKKLKRRSDKRTRSQIVSENFHNDDMESSQEIPEIVMDKLERIYKPRPSDIGSCYSQGHINVRVVPQCLSSSDEEKDPSRTEHHVRTLNPNHNNFEMVSKGVQTDWSWLRDTHNLDQNKLDGADIEELKERIKYGLYAGFGPQNPGLFIFQ
jgi:hypothetical protein